MASKNPKASEQVLEKTDQADADAVILRDPADASTYRILNRTQEGVEKAMQIFTDNLRGQKLTERNLPRVTVPPNGITLWTVPGTEGDEHHEELTGILVEYTTPRAYWDKPMEPGNTTPPSCSSHDGFKGVGDPGGTCYLCPFDKFGTALGESQNGKACKEKRMLFLLRPDSILPLVIQGPSTSIPGILKYVVGLSNEEVPFHHIYTRLTLEKVPAGSLSYSRIVLRSLGPVPEEYIPQIEAYQATLTELLGTHELNVIADAENIVEEYAAANPALQAEGDQAEGDQAEGTQAEGAENVPAGTTG